MTSDVARAQLIHIDTDRRLGHEWDEWDGRPLPGNGDFSAPPSLFFRYAGVTLALAAGGAAAAHRSVAGARRRGGHGVAVVRRAAPFLLWTRAAAARGVARAGALPPPHEPDVPRRAGVRQSGLGGARRHRRLQRARRAAAAPRGEG